MRELMLECLELLLRCVVRFCLRHSLTIQDLTEAAKKMFVTEAETILDERGENRSTSKLSVMTGLRRREVDRMLGRSESFPKRTSAMTQITGMWQTHPDFTTKAGKPRILRVDEEVNEFEDLVQRVTTDIKPGAVLSQLKYLGVLAESSRGLKLLTQGYQPSSDTKEIFHMLSADADDLVCAVEENVLERDSMPNLHSLTEFTNIRSDKVPEVREWLLKEGASFQTRVRNYLSKYDLDVNPRQAEDGGVRIVCGAFSRVKSIKEKH